MAARIYMALMAALTLAVIYVAPTSRTYSVELLINVVLYGTLSLLSVFALQREKHFRGVFYQMWFLFTSFTLLIASEIFSTLLRSDRLQSDIYVFSTMLLPLFVCWTVVYVLYAYVFSDWPRPRRIFLTLATILPVWLIAFYPYYFNPHALAVGRQISNALLYYQPLFNRAIYVNLLSFSAVVSFFLIKIRSDRAIGVYIDTLMFWFCLFIVFEILYNFSSVTVHSVFTISQYAAIGTLLMIAATFILRLRFLSHAAGVLYESQILSPEPFVGRRSGFFDRFIRGNFFDSEAIAKRVYLETPRGHITAKFAGSRPTGAAAHGEAPALPTDKRETEPMIDRQLNDRGD
jgi:hypothetical protein